MIGTLEDELVTALIILRMRNASLQDTITVETLSLEEVIKRAIIFEHSKKTTSAFQTTNSRPYFSLSANPTSKINQKPIMFVKTLINKVSDRKPQTKRRKTTETWYNKCDRNIVVCQLKKYSENEKNHAKIVGKRTISRKCVLPNK